MFRLTVTAAATAVALLGVFVSPKLMPKIRTLVSLSMRFRACLAMASKGMMTDG
jgi:hypothetical protein